MLGRGRALPRRLIIGDGSELTAPWMLSLRRVDKRLMNDEEIGFIL